MLLFQSVGERHHLCCILRCKVLTWIRSSFFFQWNSNGTGKSSTGAVGRCSSRNASLGGKQSASCSMLPRSLDLSCPSNRYAGSEPHPTEHQELPYPAKPRLLFNTRNWGSHHRPSRLLFNTRNWGPHHRPSRKVLKRACRQN